MLKIIYLIICLLVTIVAILFFSQNDDFVTLNYYFGHLEIRLSYLILIVLVLGFCMGVLSLLPITIKQRLHLSSKKRQLQQQSEELNNLRALPIKDNY